MDLNKQLRPELALFAMACEFRMRLHDAYYGNSWPNETPESIKAGLERNLKDLLDATDNHDFFEMVNEACDVADWAWFGPMQREGCRQIMERMAANVEDEDYVYPDHRKA